MQSLTYPELLDAMRDTADRQQRQATRTRALDHVKLHNSALAPVESVVNALAHITAELGPDADVQKWLRDAADRHEQLAKVLWSVERQMSPVRALEDAA